MVIEPSIRATHPSRDKPKVVAGMMSGLRTFARTKPAGPRLCWAIAIAALLTSVGPSKAHRTWSNGLPVPDWVLRSCCGVNDAHRLSPDQVHRVPNGYRIDGYPRVIFDAQVLPSEDGEYWAFYSEGIDADGVAYFSSVYCFFAPSAG